MKKNTIIITFILMLSNILVKFLGLIRDIVLANTYGTSIYSDAYIIANNIPIVIFSVVAIAISTAFIPIYSEIRERENENEALSFANNFINILLIISLIITIVGIMFPGLLVNLFAHGFTGETYKITVQFTRILMPSVIVIALMSVAGSYLQLKEDFLPISYVSIPNNLIIIASIFIAFYENKPYILAFGTTLGMISQLIYYCPFMKKNGYKHSFKLDIKDKYIKKVLKMVGPVFIGVAVNEVNIIIDRTLVSGLEEGSIAALNYSSKLIGFVTGVFIVSIITIIYPKMSKLSAKFEYKILKVYILKIFSIISLIIVPITIITVAYSNDIVRIIFQRGSFNIQSTQMTSIALIAYSIGLLAIGYREVLTKIYFSLKDTKTPMINGAIAVIFNIILNLILIKKIGFVGSAFSTSITAIITTILLSRKLKNSIGNIFSFKFIIKLVQIVSISFISVVLGKNIIIINSNANILNQILMLIISLIIITIIYIILLILFKNDEIIELKIILRNKFKERILK